MKQIQTTLPNFQVYVDGEIQVPTITERAVTHFTATFTGFKQKVGLQLRMATFDTLHGTNYRRIRNRLAREKRNKQFEESLGLVRVR